MATAENVPEDLKAIAPYLQRAAELKEREPIVAYYCTFFCLVITL
jgi:vacuolar protein sorting-associated protein VTA1